MLDYLKSVFKEIKNKRKEEIALTKSIKKLSDVEGKLEYLYMEREMYMECVESVDAKIAKIKEKLKELTKKEG